MKILSYDTETTGTNPGRHSIHQIAGIILINGKEKERFEINMKPNPKAKIDPEALKVSNKTIEDIMNNELSFQEGYRTFWNMITKYVDKYDKKDKMFLLGYNNASFDDQFLRGMFLQNGDDYFGSLFWADPLDVRVLAARQLAPIRPQMENFKLMTVARQMGIEIQEEKLHDAVYDCEITLEVFTRLNLTKAEKMGLAKDFENRLAMDELLKAVDMILQLGADDHLLESLGNARGKFNTQPVT